MIQKHILIDSWNKMLTPINLVQHEKDSRTLIFTITESGKALDLSGCTIAFQSTKPSGDVLFNNCEILEAEKGKVAYKVSGQTVSESGTLTCLLEIQKDQQILRSIPFSMQVQPAPHMDNAIESSSEFTALEEALDRVETLGENMVTVNTDQVIEGQKVYSQSPKIPGPEEPSDAVNKAYVDENTVNLSGEQTIVGKKIFLSNITAPEPFNDNDVATKFYVDKLATPFLRRDESNFDTMPLNSVCFSHVGNAQSFNQPLNGLVGGSQWWNVETYGVSNRTFQRATQVYQGQLIRQGRTFMRCKHDNLWSSWQEVMVGTTPPSPITPTLANGWVNMGFDEMPCTYYKDACGIVHILGTVKGGTMGASIFSLSSGYRPAKNITLSVISNDASAKLKVYSDGQVVPYLGSNVYVAIHVHFPSA